MISCELSADPLTCNFAVGDNNPIPTSCVDAGLKLEMIKQRNRAPRMCFTSYLFRCDYLILKSTFDIADEHQSGNLKLIITDEWIVNSLAHHKSIGISFLLFQCFQSF